MADATIMDRKARWKCPPPPRDFRSIDSMLTDAAERFSSASKNYKDIIPAAGLEIKTCLLMLRNDGCGIVDNEDVWISKCRKTILRPCSEPIVFSYWSKLINFEIDEESIIRLSSALVGYQQKYRKEECVGRWGNSSVLFDFPSRACTALSRMIEYRNVAQSSIFIPAYVYAMIIMSHPFSDGNGRIARALVHAAFSMISNIEVPSIPLAPAFYANAGLLHKALGALSDSEDWVSYLQTFSKVIDDAISLAQHVKIKF